jgi:p-aminobenzoyl-glutamate transporter AbgT
MLTIDQKQFLLFAKARPKEKASYNTLKTATKYSCEEISENIFLYFIVCMNVVQIVFQRFVAYKHVEPRLHRLWRTLKYVEMEPER